MTDSSNDLQLKVQILQTCMRNLIEELGFKHAHIPKEGICQRLQQALNESENLGCSHETPPKLSNSEIRAFAAVGTMSIELEEAKGLIQWLEDANTLHRSVKTLYTVDGYSVWLTWDDEPISEDFEAGTLYEALSLAKAGFDLDAPPRSRSNGAFLLDYANEVEVLKRALAKVTQQRDELHAVVREQCHAGKEVLSKLDRIFDAIVIQPQRKWEL